MGPQEHKTSMDDSIQGGHDRRHFLKCMTWAGTAMVWTVAGGVPRSRLIGSAEAATTGFNFVQISDSHLGFDKPANPNTTATLQEALNDVAALPGKPAFMIHTGDITHLSKPAQFDTARQLLGQVKLDLHTVPGEHDILEDDGKSYLNHFGNGSKGDGWYSFDAGGVHFIAMVNVVNLKGNGLGDFGHEQFEWLERDVKGLSASTPIVVFAHVPLWVAYSAMGLGHRGWRTGTELFEEVRVGDGAERPHPPGAAEGGRARGVSYRALDCVSAAGAGHCEGAGTDVGAAERAAAVPRGLRASAWCRRRRHWRSSIRHWQRLKEPSCQTFCNRAGWPGGWCCAARRAPGWVG